MKAEDVLKLLEKHEGVHRRYSYSKQLDKLDSGCGVLLVDRCSGHCSRCSNGNVVNLGSCLPRSLAGKTVVRMKKGGKVKSGGRLSGRKA